MDYAKIAIILWIMISVILAIRCKRSVFRQFGIPQNSIGSPIWRAYLICCAAIGMFISMGITYVIRSFAESIS